MNEETRVAILVEKRQSARKRGDVKLSVSITEVLEETGHESDALFRAKVGRLLLSRRVEARSEAS